MIRTRSPLGIVLSCLALPATAHVFVEPYSLPLPFAFYAYGATAALAVSFLIVALFAAAPAIAGSSVSGGPGSTENSGSPQVVTVMRAVSAGLLLLCLVSGLIGSRNPYLNFNMTFFWIVFVLGVPYTVALLGNYYAAINPWLALVLWVEQATSISFSGRLVLPARLWYAPALLFYIAFIWLELFGQLTPRGLSVALIAYTFVNLVGAYLFGRAAWFTYGEFFSVLLAFVGTLSPRKESSRAGTSRWRKPFVGALETPALNLSATLFILFMLSSTAFDGLHSTLPWVTFFWKHIYPPIGALLAIEGPAQYRVAATLYYIWQWVSLILSPLYLFFVLYLFAAATRLLTRTSRTTSTLVRHFAPTLIPIAFAYHVTHYFTSLLSQGPQVIKQISDPFGFGWNLFGTARADIAPIMIDMGSLWLFQVSTILVGHIVGVYLAHIAAIRQFGSVRGAVISQMPMLVLMILLTNLGLWILSLPLAAS